jgi:oligopeptide/dipeptide ABC transporter ATP-binding protein
VSATLQRMPPALELDGVVVDYHRRHQPSVRAVADVSMQVRTGEVHGLVGESGCGKSTLARAVTGLIPLTSGSIVFDGRQVTPLSRRPRVRHFRRLQMVFQDPYSSLDPAMLVRESIGEPIDVHLKLSRSEKIDRVAELLHRVGLPAEYMTRYPHEFSGGQRQRITIARAIAADPKILVLDEAVSALDVSTQHQVIGLLEQLSAASGLTYLFISHDLSVVRHISDRVAVMYLGQIVEHGGTDRVFDAPAHPYTEALLSAVPVPSPKIQRARERIVLAGDPPDPSKVPPGCRFHTRCPYVMDVCRTVVPALSPVLGSGEVACHLHTDGPRLGGASVRTLRSRPKTRVSA